jgi:hypothetical protein
MVGVMTVALFGFIALVLWEGYPWFSAIAAGLATYRAWIWRKQLRWTFAPDDEEEAADSP